MVADARGPGNVLLLEVRSDASNEVIASFGARRVRAEEVAARAVEEARRYLASGAPIGSHLADQILLPLSLAGRGAYRTQAPSRHLRTNAEVIGRFLGIRIRTEPVSEDVWEVTVGAAG